MSCSGCPEYTEGLLKVVLEDFCKKISIYCLLAFNTAWEGSNTRRVDTPYTSKNVDRQFNTEQGSDDL